MNQIQKVGLYRLLFNELEDCEMWHLLLSTEGNSILEKYTPLHDCGASLPDLELSGHLAEGYVREL